LSIHEQQPGAGPRHRAWAFGAVLIALGAIAWGLPSVAVAQDDEKPTLLLLPIVVHSSENPDYLRAGLADMLASRFIQAGSFEIIRVDEPRKATTRLADALDAAREEGTDFVLFGSFTRFGEGASLDMQAAATAEGEEGQTLREIFVHSGSIGQVIPDLTDLVGKVTRFAIPGFEPAPAAAAPAAGAAPRRDDLADLRRRIAALEQAVQALEQGTAASE
jgi:hypothetical protein